MDSEYVAYHPMDNTATTAVKKETIWKLWEMLGRNKEDMIVVDYAKLASFPDGNWEEALMSGDDYLKSL